MADWPRIVEIFAGRKPHKQQWQPLKSRPAHTNPHIVISKISYTIEILEKRIDFLMAQFKEARENARAKLRSKDRQMALLYLRTSKGYEKARDSTIRRMDAVLSMRNTIEESTFNKMALDAIKVTHEFLKTAKMPKLDDVDRMVEDIVTARDEADQILTDVSSSLEPVFDESDLERELDELDEIMDSASATATTPTRELRFITTDPSKQRFLEEDPSPLQREDDDQSGLILLQ